ncbi:MAG TPA: NAD(P)-dependent oxidoreductase [Steroidobacteraceae bacterium]|nr:NAD(P)-dependent oxidoreductase [Steroidobacteraceae bacterium]
MKRIALIGLGIMGAAMARRLLDQGFELTVWNRNPARAQSLVTAGARRATTPADAARGAEAVIVMVADDVASRSIWLGADGALAAMDPGAIAIDSSTLTVEWMRELGDAAAARDIGFLDAPVTGSKRQAEEGVLNFLVGGETSVVTRASALFAAMGKGHVHLGPVGSGALMKLINNFMCGVQLASLAEAIAMAERSGLDSQVAAQVLSNGSPGSPLVRMVAERMVKRDYTPNFLVPLMVKDLDYAIRTFAARGIELLDAQAARERFSAAAEAGFGDQDIASVVEVLRRSR